MTSTKFIVTLSVALCATSANAASRLGGPTDDSVCDVGRTEKNSNIDAFKFTKNECKNGQILVGSSVVPASTSSSEIVVISKSLCTIADIEVRRVQENLMGLLFDRDEVRCRITKLK